MNGDRNKDDEEGSKEDGSGSEDSDNDESPERTPRPVETSSPISNPPDRGDGEPEQPPDTPPPTLPTPLPITDEPTGGDERFASSNPTPIPTVSPTQEPSTGLTQPSLPTTSKPPRTPLNEEGELGSTDNTAMVAGSVTAGVVGVLVMFVLLLRLKKRRHSWKELQSRRGEIQGEGGGDERGLVSNPSVVLGREFVVLGPFPSAFEVVDNVNEKTFTLAKRWVMSAIAVAAPPLKRELGERAAAPAERVAATVLRAALDTCHAAVKVKVDARVAQLYYTLEKLTDARGWERSNVSEAMYERLQKDWKSIMPEALSEEDIRGQGTVGLTGGGAADDFELELERGGRGEDGGERDRQRQALKALCREVMTLAEQQDPNVTLVASLLLEKTDVKLMQLLREHLRTFLICSLSVPRLIFRDPGKGLVVPFDPKLHHEATLNGGNAEGKVCRVVIPPLLTERFDGVNGELEPMPKGEKGYVLAWRVPEVGVADQIQEGEDLRGRLAGSGELKEGVGV